MSEAVSKDEHIRLLELCPEKRDNQEPFRYLESSLQDGPPFDAIACMPRNETSNKQIVVSEAFQDIFHQLRLLETSRFLWVEELCIDHASSADRAKHGHLLKEIYATARNVIIWAGNDHEDDCFEQYLGKGTQKTTKHAFEFAQLLAAAPAANVTKLLQQRYSETGIHSWAYLIRICCRPFFRGLPLLRTNYVEDRPSLSARCSSSTIPWSTLQKAAQRLRIAHPTPHFLLQASTTPENQMKVLHADREYLLSSLRFGLDLAKFIARNYWLFNDKDSPHHQRFLAHLGFCEDDYDFEGSGVLPFVQRHYEAIEGSSISGEEPVDEALFESPPNSLPSLPFEGRQSLPPVAENQAPFIHTHLNRGTKLQLLLILPDTDLSAPLQCGLVEAKVDKPPKFAFVLNHSFHCKPLPPTGKSEPEFPVTTRSMSTILVNNQAFTIPRLQEVFLRLVRQPSEEKHIFLWNICMYPEEAGLKNRENVEDYVMVKYFMKVKAKAEPVDMYEVLERAGKDRTLADLGSLGLPGGMEWDAWMLQLND
jgi:hypothetical protein